MYLNLNNTVANSYLSSEMNPDLFLTNSAQRLGFFYPMLILTFIDCSKGAAVFKKRTSKMISESIFGRIINCVSHASKHIEIAHDLGWKSQLPDNLWTSVALAAIHGQQPRNHFFT